MNQNLNSAAAYEDERFGFIKSQTKNGANLRESRESLDDLDVDLLNNQQSYRGQGVPARGAAAPSDPSIELAEIGVDLFNRLLKTGIIRASPQIKTDHDRKLVVLDEQSTVKYQNGLLFAQYLIVLKEVLAKVNQDFAINSELVSTLKNLSSPQARLFNWNLLCAELDKIGIIIENDTKSLYVAGDSDEIGKLFARVERFMKRIAGDDEILNFDNYRKDDRTFRTPSQQTPNKEALVPATLALNGRRGLQSNQRKPVKDGVDIMQMDVNRDPGETESTLEFILNTLCRALNMKPKQSAALLTNNNQFLTHCVVKGVKSRYEPMINWYQELYQYSKHLSLMLEGEVENAQQSGDAKQIKASQQNFDKVLQTISCGCYSNNIDVAQLCMKTMSCIGQDFAGSIGPAQLAMKWFQSKDNGIYTINYALRKHSGIAEEFVNTVGNFTRGGDQMAWAYLTAMEGFYPNLDEYFSTLNHIWPFLAQQYPKELLEGRSLLRSLIDKCIRFTDADPHNSPQVRIAALSLLTEIWLTFPQYIEQNDQFNNSIQHVFKKNVRDRIRSVRIVAATSMFKLLDKFSAEKNQAAPSLYKTLIFSLVENPEDQTTRELFLTNFQYLFDSVKSIPIGLLIDPFVKSNQVQDTFTFQTFDFDFFAFAARHPKLNIQNSIQILDLLARLYLNDVCNASAAAVPFMMILSRFIDAVQCQEFILKFITISLNQLLQLSNDAPEKLRTPQEKTRATLGKQKTLALPAPDGSGARSNSQLKGKEFRISSNKKTSNKAQLATRMQTQEEDVNSRLKKSLIITMLLKIQNLRQFEVNNAMKDMLLGAQKQFKEQNNGYLSNGIMAVLKYWDDPDHLFNNYMKEIEAEEKKTQQRQEQIERKMLGYESEGKDSQGRSPGSLKPVKSIGTLKGGAAGRSLALMPLTENEQNLRALHEIEMIKKLKREKEEDARLKQQTTMKKQTLNEKRLKEELMKRRVEVGVHQNVGGVKQEIKALIFKDSGETSQPKSISRKIKKNPMESQVQLVDLMEEEDRDREILNQFMKKYAKIWKFLFGRYANQAYSTKGKADFDDMGRKTSQINLAELTKMLKDHNTYPTLLSRDELASLIRLINMHTAQANSSDLAMLDYNQFLQFIPQLAFLCFSRPPIDKSSFPAVESLRALVLQFEEATRDRGRSTALYEDPDQSGFADRELVAALDKKLQADPSYPVPEGFRKVTEKIPIYEYRLPNCAASMMSESQVVATTLVDEVLFGALGIHFLEPQVQFEVKWKVKPTITKAKKQGNQAEALSYMKKADKTIAEAETKKGTAYALMSAADKRKEALEVKPKLNLALKMQVTKQDLKNRPHYQEVAEVFEEILQAAEKGLDHLPPRLNRAPGQVQNEAKLLKEQKEKEEQERRAEKEAKRKERDQHVKKLIKDTNFGGRGMAALPFKEAKKAEEADKAEKEAKAKRLAFQKAQEERRRETQAKKESKLEELKKKKEEEAAEEEVKRKLAEGIRKEFLAKEKGKLKAQFEDTYKRRDELITRKERQADAEAQNRKRLKEEMENYIKRSKPDREVEKKERQDVQAFLDSEPVAALFDEYKKPLNQMYKFYASQDDKKDTMTMATGATYTLDYLHSMMDLTEFVRFGYHQRVIPDLVSPDDMMFIYKNLLGESQDIANTKEDQKSIQNRTSGMIDYESFKKAIVRISVMAMAEKKDKDGNLVQPLGGANEDFLKQKLDRDAAMREADQQRKKDLQEQMKAKDAKKQAELDSLRQQFNEEQQQKQALLSKTNQNKAQDTQNSARSSTLAKQKRNEGKQYELDQAALQEEDKFFQKWLKQRENLGKIDANYASNRSGSVKKVKDPTQRELDELKKQQKAAEKISNIEVEDKQLRKPLDVKVITAGTIEAFFGFLGLDKADTDVELSKKLNASMVNRGSASNRSPRAGASGYNSLRKTKNDKQGLPVVEEKAGRVEDDDFDRQQEEGGEVEQAASKEEV